MTEKTKILFLCTGNAARSQMAEALARIDYGDLVRPFSAGSRPAGFVHPFARLAIEEIGFRLDDARSKPVDEYQSAALDLVVTVCDSAAADCPTWPRARHIVNWSIEDPSFAQGGDEKRLAAFRATREELRHRIDGLMEALRRPQPRGTDADLLVQGSKIVEGTLKEHGFKSDGVREEKTKGRNVAVLEFARRGRTIELQVRSGVGIALYAAAERQMLHPDYMECLGASALMRYPGLSKDPLDAFRRLRTDIVRFAGPFLTGKGLKEFGRFFDARKGGKDPARSA